LIKIAVTATAGTTQATTRQCSQKRIVRRGAIRFCDKRMLFTANFPTSPLPLAMSPLSNLCVTKILTHDPFRRFRMSAELFALF
jgi:hypothetical protein